MNDKIIIVANRLIYSLDNEGNKKLANGGLATGIASYFDKTDSETVFIGWPGKEIEPEKQETVRQAYKKHSLVPVFYNNLEQNLFYEEYCNRVLWQVAHLTATEDNTPVARIIADVEEGGDYAWQKYVEINQRFADAIIEEITQSKKNATETTIWIQDYHLMLVPQMLREKYPDLKIGYFHHIPIPLPADFYLIPKYQRQAILNGLLGADQIAFHTDGYRRNFVNILKEHGFAATPNDKKVVVATTDDTQPRIAQIATIPIGIDYEKYANVADDETVIGYIEGEKTKGLALNFLLQNLPDELQNSDRELTYQIISALKDKAQDIARSLSAEVIDQAKTLKLVKNILASSSSISLTKKQLALISKYSPKLTMSLIVKQQDAKTPEDLFANNTEKFSFTPNDQQQEMLLQLQENLKDSLGNIDRDKIAKERKLVKLLTILAKTDLAKNQPKQFSEKDWQLMQQLLISTIKKYHDHINSKATHLESFYNFVKENGKLETPKQIFLSVDRMDISKNIPEKLEAILELLERYPELADKIRFEFICVPSREGVKEYRELGQRVRKLETIINNKYPGILQIHHCDYAAYPGLVQWFYHQANVLVAIPKIDGFNLVIPESYAANDKNPNFITIISDTIGVAQYLPNELVVKISEPNNIELIAEKYFDVFNMSPEEKATVTRHLQQKIKNEISIFAWAENNLLGIEKAAEKRDEQKSVANATLTLNEPHPPYDRNIIEKLDVFQPGSMTPLNVFGGWGGPSNPISRCQTPSSRESMPPISLPPPHPLSAGTTPRSLREISFGSGNSSRTSPPKDKPILSQSVPTTPVGNRHRFFEEPRAQNLGSFGIEAKETISPK